MKKFMEEDFLLGGEVAKALYSDHAEKMPVIDYHCHLDAKEIAENRPFESITQLWLGGDHYKWRAMRANGVDERYITGDASDWEKFEKWAETIPYALGNPLYHWTHLELKRAFGIDRRLNPESAREIYDEVNVKLKTDPTLTPRGLMRKFGVEVVCTTDDPADTLEHHLKLREEGFEIKVLPTWRPDRALQFEDAGAYAVYLKKLGDAAGIRIESLTDLKKALRRRHDFFAEAGCRLSDHGLPKFYSGEISDKEAEEFFAVVRAGDETSQQDAERLKAHMLEFLGELDYEKGWTQQFHYGPIRNTNSRMMKQLGADAGYDSMGDTPTANDMARFLDSLARKGKLGKTIIYNINPADNDMLATMIGNFQDGTVAGKIQMGSGWWFNDQRDGILRQLRALSVHGLLSRFVGMLTDSRSFLSYPRHEYFRRVLCGMIGEEIETGRYPYDGYEKKRVERMVEDICYHNAKEYFNF